MSIPRSLLLTVLLSACSFVYAQIDTQPIGFPVGDLNRPILLHEDTLNTLKLADRIVHIQSIDRGALTGTWTMSVSTMQYADSSGLARINLGFEGYKYTFRSDGTYSVDAEIDTDGIWELLENNTVLYLHNRVRDDEEVHYVFVSGNTLELVNSQRYGCIYQLMERKK